MNSQENLVLHHLSRRRMDGESGRDRDALIAYHHEVANEAGYTQLARKALKIFGVLGGGGHRIGGRYGSCGPSWSTPGSSCRQRG